MTESPVEQPPTAAETITDSNIPNGDDASNVKKQNESDTPPKPVEVLQPNATLYVSNIDWSIKKPILKRSLHALFGRHGKILDIVTLRRQGLRGQAWVVFEDITAATAALQAENGFTFFGKDLRVSYAREKSDRVAKLDGTFVPKDRRAKRRQQELEQQEAEAAKKKKKQKLEDGSGVDASEGGGGGGEGGAPSSSNDGNENEASAPPPPPPPPPTESIKKEEEEEEEDPSSSSPTNVLFAENLPKDCNEMMLTMLFHRYAGYKEVRIPRSGLAFVEFDDEPHATLALRGMNGFKLTPNDKLDLKYSKK